MWLYYFIFFHDRHIVCLNIEFFSIKYLSREKVNFGTAKTQNTADGFLKGFKLDSIQCCKKQW